MDNQMNQYDNGGGYNGGNRGNNPGGNNGGNGNQPPRKPNVTMMVLAALSTVLIAFMLWNMVFGSTAVGQEVSYTQFLQYIGEGKVEAVEVQSTGQILFTLKKEENLSGGNADGYLFYPANTSKTYSTILMEDLDTLTSRLEEQGKPIGHITAHARGADVDSAGCGIP